MKGCIMVAVVGGRDFKDYNLMKQVLDGIKPKKIISGGARGADILAEQYSAENEIPNVIYRPNWAEHGAGKFYGYERNVFIIHEATSVVAFWDGKSLGTKHCIELALKQKKNLTVINYNISF
jgi:hypothetical protein